MRFTTVFLDMGDTLAFAYPSWTDVYHRVYGEAGVAIDRETVHEVVESVWRSVIAQDATAAWEATEAGDRRRIQAVESAILDRLGVVERRRQIIEHVANAFRDPASYQLFPDVPATLQALRDRGCTLAIVSNWNWHLPELCRGLGLARYFDAIITSARVGRAKPHPQIFHTALAQTAAEPARTLHVGDSYNADILGARQVGIAAVLVDRDGTAGTDGHYTIRSLTELPSLLDSR